MITFFNGFYQKLKDSEIPLLYEIYVLGGNSGGVQLIYSAREEVVTGHANTVKRIQNLVMTN